MDQGNALAFHQLLVEGVRKEHISDGTIEYYDCEDTFLNPLPESDTGLPSQFDYDWKTNSQSPWGLDDDFEEPDIGEISCSPFDPDQNIIMQDFIDSDGTFVLDNTNRKI